MEIKDFINTCVDNEYVWKEDEHEGIPGYLIGSEKYDTVTHFTPESIKNNDWPVLNKQIIQGRNVYQITRIVGYFSRVENWNKSKLGELKDRHGGDYKIG